MSVSGIILAVVIGVFGAFAGNGFGGLIIGAIVGYCLGAVITLSGRVNQLGKKLLKLDDLVLTLKYELWEKTKGTPDASVAETTPTDVVKPAEPVKQQTPEPVPPPPAEVKRPVPMQKQTTARPAPLQPQQQTTHPLPSSSPPRFEENVIDKAMAYIHKFFTDGNVVVKVGMLFLIIGVGFLLKYAYDEQLFTVSMPVRFTGAALLGLALVIFGWRFRDSKRLYALVLQGGGIGVMYLTVFGATKFFSMIPISMAFIIMVGLVAFSAMLAILQNAKSLALFGAIGGFLAPVLLSTGEGNHVVLFSYYTLLNVGILAIAWFKSWRELNLLGFIFTFGIAGIWGASRYTTADFYTTEPFLIIYFLMYVAIAILYAFRQPPELKGYIDGSLIFGVPVISFGYQAAIVFDTFQTGMSVAFSALAMGGFYIALASSLWRRGPPGMRLLSESFLALGVVFASLAIPLALDGRWSSAAWALEGAALVWVGIRQHRVLPRLFGVLLQFGAGYFFLSDFHPSESSIPVLNGFYLGGVIISISALFASYSLYKNIDTIRWYEKPVHIILFVWGLIWWFVMGLIEVESSVRSVYLVNSSFAFITLSLYLCYVTQFWTQWKMMRLPVLANLYVMLLMLFVGVIFRLDHPFEDFGSIVWLVSLTLQYWYLYRYRDEVSQPVLQWQHIMTFWLVIILFTWEGVYAIDKLVSGGDAWRDIMYVLVPALFMFALLMVAKKISWPFKQHYLWYISHAAAPVMFALTFVAAGFALLHEGNAWPVNYIPVMNPIDLVVLFLLYLLVVWRIALAKVESRIANMIITKQFYYVLAGLGFVWLNGMLARTIHHWFDVRYSLHSLLSSDLFQGSISVLWTVLALTIMTVASRRLSRHLWFIGLGLFIIVAAKLFLFDIANAGALAMAISITVVGVLAVIFGYYLSPLPPQKEGEQA
ncbi:hypothetical protein MNBD_GAMMA21-335 [hydrothermal vent metagenome]|uniref:DUF2339 domain-containing protein n=1 Tax=hydrothermal vent metagenome TaxID=652676 RepID=A0A3B0ZV86_9ZZZZ